MSLNIRPIELNDNLAVARIVWEGLREIENAIYRDFAWHPFPILSSYLVSLALYWIYPTPLICLLGPTIVGVLLALNLKYVEIFVINPGAKVYNKDLMDLFTFYTEKGRYLVVAELDDTIVGCGGFSFEGPNTIRLKRIFFTASVRRKGIGSKVLQVLLEKANELQVKRILLETSRWQMPAVKFYTRHGFKIILTSAFLNIHFFPGYKYTQFIMERLL